MRLMLRLLVVAVLTISLAFPGGDPWATPAGRTAKAEIAKLKHKGIFDDLREYHDELTDALRERCVNFVPWPSRIECPGMKNATPEACAVAANVKVLFRVMPVALDPAAYRGVVRWSERGKNRVVLEQKY